MMMLFASLASLFLLAAPVLAQGDLSADHNVTGLAGSWSSGSQQVMTGAVSSTSPSRHCNLDRRTHTTAFAPLGICQPN